MYMAHCLALASFTTIQGCRKGKHCSLIKIYFRSFIQTQEVFFNGLQNLQIKDEMIQLDRVDPISGDLVMY